MPDDKIYMPLHVGREGKSDLGYQGDNTGDNISLKNAIEGILLIKKPKVINFKEL